MPRLRGHHLLCLHFFHGEGYDKEFADNLAMVLDLLGAPVRALDIVYGPDDVCVKCRHLQHGKCMHSDNADEEIRAMDAMAMRLLSVSPGKLIGWDEIRRRLPAAFPAWHAAHCRCCEWRRACEKDTLYLALLTSS